MQLQNLRSDGGNVVAIAVVIERLHSPCFFVSIKGATATGSTKNKPNNGAQAIRCSMTEEEYEAYQQRLERKRSDILHEVIEEFERQAALQHNYGDASAFPKQKDAITREFERRCRSLEIDESSCRSTFTNFQLLSYH